MTGLLDDRLKEIVKEKSAKLGIGIIPQETERDHIHILFSCRPSIARSRFINSLKSVVSRRLRQEFPAVMREHLWGGGCSTQPHVHFEVEDCAGGATYAAFWTH